MRSALLFAVVLVSSTPSCKPAVASADECEQVSEHLAQLVVKKEKKPPMGRLASPPFNTPDNEKDVHDEAKNKAKPRCLKGWKRQVFDCMMAAKEIEAADKCRFE
ncbi:MAG: hypothetical protein JNL79_31630 [Myxococcales bacterium]|nr:hypothetical protein [Myxococcales bacterium]